MKYYFTKMGIYLTESVTEGESSNIIEFIRTSDGKRKINTITNFKPYFYVNAEEKIPQGNGVLKIEQGYKSIFGNPVKKVFVTNTKQLVELRKKLVNTWEADILFDNRYLLDMKEEIEEAPLQIYSLDIETTDDKFPDIDNPDQEITMISLTDSFSEKTTTWSWREDFSLKINSKLKTFKTEKGMLINFLDWFYNYYPDILTGWNIVNFDIKYIINRCNLLRINYKKLSPVNEVYIGNYGDITIKGIILIDSLKLYKHFRRISNMGELRSYSLDWVSKEELGEKKVERSGISFRDMWQHHFNEFMKYNRVDAELVLKILKKNDIITFFDSLRRKSYCQFKDVFMTGKIVESYLMNKHQGKVIFPNKPSTNGTISDDTAYQGALVKEPTPGLYNNVISLDLASLYPNVMRTCNISFETLTTDKSQINTGEGIYFQKGKGMIPKFIDDLITERKEYKKLMSKAGKDNDKDLLKKYNYLQYAVKVVINSSYGYLGFKNSRLYKKEIAAAITRVSRNIITWSMDLLESNGRQVVMSDTDSVGVVAKNKNLIPLLKEGKQLKNLINASYDDFVKTMNIDKNKYLNMEFECINKTMLFLPKGSGTGGAKKLYAYKNLWVEGKKVDNKVNMKGLSSKRSDSADLTRDVQMTVLDMVLDNKKMDTVVNYLTTVKNKIEQHEIEPEQLGVPKGITKKLTEYNPPMAIHKGCIYSNTHFNTNFDKGNKVKYIYIKYVPDGYPETQTLTIKNKSGEKLQKTYKVDAISFDKKIPEGFVIDYDKMLEVTIKKKVLPIFNAMGWPWFYETKKPVKKLDKCQKTLI